MASAWTDTVEDFLLTRAGGRCRPATIRTYRICLVGPRTQAWLADRGITSPEQVTPGDMRSLGVMLTEAGNRPATLHAYHRTMKTFLRWCSNEGHEINARALALEAPKIPQVMPQVFDRAQIEALVRAAPTARDRFLVEFLAGTGLRRAELCAATLDDIMTTEDGRCWFRVQQGKWAKDRIVPLDTPRLRLSGKLVDYVERVRPRVTDLRHLFLSPPTRVRTTSYEPLTPNGVQMVLERLGRATGIHVHAHAFRHTWATEALRGGVDMEALRKAGGWTTYRMVQRYTHYNPDDLVDAWERRRD